MKQAPAWNQAVKEFANDNNVAFGDVNLAEAQIRGNHNPGAGGWPTIRYFNQETGDSTGIACSLFRYSYGSNRVWRSCLCKENSEVDVRRAGGHRLYASLHQGQESVMLD